MNAWYYIKNSAGKYWQGGAQKMARFIEGREEACNMTSRAVAQAQIDGGVFEPELAKELVVEEVEIGS